MATQPEKRVLEAARFWYEVLLRKDVLATYEIELFVAIAEWIKEKDDVRHPWDITPTHFTLPPPPHLTVEDALGRDVFRELTEENPEFDKMPTIPAPSRIALLAKKLV